MINQYEVPAYLADELPGMDQQLKSIAPTLNIFKTIQCLVSYTKANIIQHDMGIVKKTFTATENIYLRGNDMVRAAIENVFVFSLPSLLNMGNKEERNQLQALMPLSLHTVYVQQVLKSGL